MNRGFIEGYETRSVSYQDGAGTTTIKVWLSQIGEGSIIGKELNVLSSTKLTSTFNLTGASSGKWTVNAKRTDGFITAVLTDAFTVKPGPVPAAKPVITDISNNHILVGSPAYSLVVTGSNFVQGTRNTSGSVICWNGKQKETAFLSGTRLKAAIPGTDLSRAGRVDVTVFTPGGGTSKSVQFKGCFIDLSKNDQLIFLVVNYK
jgi:hypothetical protein